MHHIPVCPIRHHHQHSNAAHCGWVVLSVVQWSMGCTYGARTPLVTGTVWRDMACGMQCMREFLHLTHMICAVLTRQACGTTTTPHGLPGVCMSVWWGHNHVTCSVCHSSVPCRLPGHWSGSLLSTVSRYTVIVHVTVHITARRGAKTQAAQSITATHTSVTHQAPSPALQCSVPLFCALLRTRTRLLARL